MWLRNSLLVIMLALSACGFQPLYGQRSNDGSPQTLAGVSVDPISASTGRMGQQFKADLEDKLNPQGAVPPRPSYRLSATLVSTSSAIGIARDGTVSRYNVYLDSAYTLYRNSDGKPVTKGSLRHVSSYNNIANEYFSTYVSEEDAVKRGITELAEAYRQRLSSHLAKVE
jgi:LPS-assembly lipoprotein